jgi:hypothetical protein
MSYGNSAPQAFKYNYRLIWHDGSPDWTTVCKPVGKLKDAQSGLRTTVIRFDPDEPSDRAHVWAVWTGTEFVQDLSIVFDENGIERTYAIPNAGGLL